MINNHKIDFAKINDNSIIVDAGACMGEFIKFVRNKSNCRIIALEPDIEHRKKLISMNFHNVNIVGCALTGDGYPDYIKFYSYRGLPKWGNVYNRKVSHPKLQGIMSYFVPTLWINRIFSVFNIDYIDYLKLDIEEAEFDVFSTMTFQTASKIKQFSAEIHPISSHTYKDVDNLVKKIISLGYRIEWTNKNIELWAIQNHI